MEKRRYYKFDDESLYKDFNYRVWNMMTSAEQMVWQPLDKSGWENEKRFTLYRDEQKFRFFSQKVWDGMLEDEQDNWKADSPDWPVVKKLSMEEKKAADEEARIQHNKNTAKTSMDNLRVKEGTQFDMLGSTGEILKWGSQVYLIRFWQKSDPKNVKYGTMQRFTRDTSYGAADTFMTNPVYSRYATFELAERAYEHANQ